MLNRPLAALSAAALVLTLGATAPAHASVASKAPGHAGHWLEAQLTGGLIHNGQYDFDDYVLTADTAFALEALGGHADTVRTIRKALARHVGAWTTYGSEVYAGSVAKALVLAESAHGDPRDFGGINLVKGLNRRVSSTAPYVGRIEDKAATDYANTIGQAFAARGLAVARSNRADDAIRFLLKQQCSKGFFRLNFADKSAAKQGCDAGTRAQSSPDTDVTALTVIQLEAVPHKSRKVERSIRDAVAWLKRNQRANGSFGGGTSTADPNTNSTGLAGWALGEAGRCGPAVKAATWVRKLQVTDQVAGERGAIAYDKAGFKAATADGITTAARDQWRRATAQAAPALLNRSLEACSAP